MTTLPKGWMVIPIGELCAFNPKHSPDEDRSKTVAFVPMPAVDDKSGRINDCESRPLGEVWKGYTHFQNGDVIFAKITPCMENGKIAVAERLKNGLACGSTEFHVMRPEHTLVPEYLWRYLRQRSFRSTAEKSMTGAVGQRRVPKLFLEGWPLPLPPVAEQKRIVAKVESLTAKSARARTELETIDRFVDRYKQALLSKAISGELQGCSTSTWRAVQVGGLTCDVRYGTSKKCEFNPVLTPVLRIPNIVSGQIDTSDLKHASFNQDELEKLSLRKGDLLLIRSNGSLDLVGRSAVICEAGVGFLYAGYLIRLRMDLEQVDPWFIHYTFQSPAKRKEIERLAKSTSGVNNINSQQIRALEIYVPPLAEQHEIVRRIEAAFAKVDRLAAEAKQALELTDRLDEKILAKAFRGELVPQDPNDEPASVLLERTRAERADAPKAKRTRKAAGA